MYKKIVIGRESGCDIVVEPEYSLVSGRHATMYVDSNGEIIFEDNSRNGSLVNGTSVTGDAVKVAFGAPIVLGGNYNLSWQKIQPLLYRGPQSCATCAGSSSAVAPNVLNACNPNANQNAGFGGQTPTATDSMDLNFQPGATQTPSMAESQSFPSGGQSCPANTQQASYPYGYQPNSLGPQPYNPAPVYGQTPGYGQTQMP